MESIRRLHEEILKREYKAEKQRKEEMRYDQMDCLLLAGEEKTERTIPVCETVFPEKFADLNAVREVLLAPEKQVYALIAPAFMGQFGEGVSPGAIRAALKRAGFSGMVEVAVFADILTLKEALEFDRHVNRDTDCSCLVCDRSCNRLTDPPGCVGGELISLAVIEFFHSLNKTQVTFLDQVEE